MVRSLGLVGRVSRSMATQAAAGFSSFKAPCRRVSAMPTWQASIPTPSMQERSTSNLVRLCRQLTFLDSFLPLHSSIASACLVSRLSTSECHLNLEGTLCHVSPDR